MDHVMTPEGLLSVEAYRERVPRPVDLWCAGKDRDGRPCMRKADAVNFASVKRPFPHFRAEHIPGCDEGSHQVEQLDGDRGHAHPVGATDRLRIRLGSRPATASGAALHRPDENRPGTSTRRLVPTSGLDSGVGRDRTRGMRQVLLALLGGGYPPETVIVDPITPGRELAASEYFVHLGSAATAPAGAARGFWGTIQHSWHREDSGSLGLSVRPRGSARLEDRPVYISKKLEDQVLGDLAGQSLRGCAVLVFGRLAPSRTYIRYDEVDQIIVIQPPDTPAAAVATASTSGSPPTPMAAAPEPPPGETLE